MSTVLILAHAEAGAAAAKSAFEALTAAKRVVSLVPGSQLAVGLVGTEVQAMADALAACGAGKFYAVEGPEFGAARYATDAAAAEALCRASGAEVVVAPGTSRWNRVLPGVAQRVGGVADTHVTGVTEDQGALAVNRWYYRQRMEAVLGRTRRPWFLAVDPGTHPAWEGAAGQVAVEKIPASLPAGGVRTVILGIKEPAADAQTIRPDAQLLFVAGAGWTKKQADGQSHVKDAEHLILNFLNRTRASLGSSKSLVDLGGEGQAVLSFLSHLNQIGQTGATPRHPKGLATCCHGEEPHTVGWRFINERRAVNLDPNCGWARGKADVLYVADAFAVMAKVNEMLAR